jgi:hypothetical protein
MQQEKIRSFLNENLESFVLKDIPWEDIISGLTENEENQEKEEKLPFLGKSKKFFQGGRKLLPVITPTAKLSENLIEVRFSLFIDKITHFILNRNVIFLFFH